MDPITETEIIRAEKVLLSEGQHFDEPRIKVIKDIDNSCNVVACPGSGKTTVLLTKLLILANRMPFENNQGICVLTHTNIAIDEIKKKAGTAGDKLFKYPNFFGTIQSFVDKYLAIPAYTYAKGKKITIIDNDRYKVYFDKFQYKYLGREGIAFCKRMTKKGYPYSISLSDLEVDKSTNTCKKLGLNLNNDKEKRIYKKLELTKSYMINAGYLTFKDAYKFANDFISNMEIIKQLRQSFSRRFNYVFVDEMQDTDTHQLKIIESLFENTSTKIQYYGDPNQAIFDNKVKDEEVWKVPLKDAQNRYDISDSKRYGESIAKILNQLKIVPDIDLSGDSEVNTLKPILILFENGKEKEVLKIFAELINNHKDKWSVIEKPVYKAIGWVSQNKDEENKKRVKKGKETIITIPSYYNDFEKKSNQKKQVYDGLKSYLRRQENNTNVKTYYNNILNAFLRCLELAGKKYQNGNKERNYTKTTLLKELDNKKGKHRILSKIAVWAKKIHSGKDVFEEIKRFIETDFVKIFKFQINEELKKFLALKVYEEDNKNPKDEEKNYIYEYTVDIKIEIGTVHSIKGETHTATLYMETYRYNYETKKIIEFLTGEVSDINKINNNSRKKETLKMVHVGFSRPTHLLCFAVCKDNLNDRELNKLNCGIDENNYWEIKTT